MVQPGKGVTTGSHWGIYRAQMAAGRVIEMEGLEGDPEPAFL